MTQQSKTPVRTLTLVGLVTALMCVVAPFSVQLPGMVPISLGTLVVYLMPYLLGTRKAMVSCLLYLLLGAVGMPVFTGFTGGLPKILGPTGGYMLGYFCIIFCVGTALQRFAHSRTAQLAGMVVGTLGCYLLGTLWLGRLMHLGFVQALWAGVIPFIPGDCLKMAAVLLVAPVLCRRLHLAMLMPDARGAR